MSENGQAAAITALFTVGILLLNYGFNMIQQGDLYGGLTVILFGVALILAAVLITKLMIQNIIGNFLSGFQMRYTSEKEIKEEKISSSSTPP